MRSVSVVVLVLVTGLLAASVRGQDVEEADRLYDAEQWEPASLAYRELLSEDPYSARALFRWGVCLRHLGRYEEALGALAKAEANGTPPQFVGYQMAATHALRGDATLAFESLDKALEAGFSQPEELASDEAFATLREDDRLQQAIHRAETNARPCELLPEYHEFDFWVGEWEVSAGGRTAGTNTIERAVSGCALLENWTSAGGGTGKSVNYYDPGKKKWIQIWVDSGGDVIQTEGGLVDGSMKFEGKHIYRNGSEEHFRMTFTPLEDGSVRQFIEQSADEGTTWYVWFDGTYRKN